jgi:predicted DNA-binding transcriptional regulator
VTVTEPLELIKELRRHIQKMAELYIDFMDHLERELNNQSVTRT